MKGTILTLIVLTAVSAVADDAVPLAGYHLKNRSTFDSAGVKRPPFWPIGWVHHDRTQQEVVQPKVTLDPQMFAVTSISLGHPSVAIINGRSYLENDFIKGSRKVDSSGKPDPTAKAVPSTAKIRV